MGAQRGRGLRQPTLETVAAVAGVSRATVSRVINGSPRVSEQVKKAVEEAIRYLGYVPNPAARSLVTRRTGSVALVLREPAEFGLADPYLSSMVIATSQALMGTGVQLVLMMAADDPAHASPVDYVRAGHVDGVLLTSMHGDDPLARELASAGIPTVVGGRPPAGTKRVAYVDVENVQGAQLAVRRLVATGRRRIAHIGGPDDMAAAADRLAGHRAGMAEEGLPAQRVAYGTFTRQSGADAAAELLERWPELDGVFAANDLMAIGAMQTLRQAGRRVPDDVAVVGFDDIELAAHVHPTLTTVHQPVAEMARTMCALLLSQVAGGPRPDPVVLPTRLVERESA